MRTARFVIDPGTTKERVLPSKTPPFAVPKGSRILLQSAGGGGFGPPWQRRVESVLSDVRDSYITIDGAHSSYYIALDDDGTEDENATARFRADAAPAARFRVNPEVWSYGNVESNGPTDT